MIQGRVGMIPVFHISQTQNPGMKHRKISLPDSALTY